MDAKTARWFKIDQAGLYPDKTWASAKLTAQGGKWTFKLPSTLTDGNYFLRSELIALHGASAPGGAQLYPACLTSTHRRRLRRAQRHCATARRVLGDLDEIAVRIAEVDRARWSSTCGAV